MDNSHNPTTVVNPSGETPFGASPGILIGDRYQSASDLAERARRLATVLAQFGVGRDATVGLLLRNDFAFLEGYVAATLLGALAVPMNWYWRPDDLEFVLGDSGASVVIAHADLVPDLISVLPEGVRVIVVDTPPETGLTHVVDNPALPPADYESLLAAATPHTLDPVASSGVLIYTSGTTGRPKGVQRDAPSGGMDPFASIKPTAEINGLYPGARALVPSPMYHGAPLAYSLAALQTGCSVVVMPRFRAETFLALVQRHRITHTQMVPTMFVRLLKLPDEVRQRYDISSLERVGHAAAPCPTAVKKAMIDWWGPIIHEYYGCTEVGVPAVSSTSREWFAHPDSVGRIRSGATVKILDDDGAELPNGAVGQIYARVKGVPDFTYRNNPAAKEEITVGGLYACGDAGYIDDEGFVYITDRVKDMINSGGIKIYSAQVEAVLTMMPGVADVAVFGLPDEEYGESVAACVEPLADAALTPEQVRAWAADNLPGYAVPRTIRIVDKLPREDSGKLLKRRLREEMRNADS